MSKRRKQFLTSTPNSPEKYSPAVAIVGSNLDLVTETLLRVPAKSLIKFKCVSKHWLSLISDSNFAINHTRRNPTPPVSGIYVGAKWSKSLILKDQFSPFSLGGRRGTSSLPALSFLRDAISGDYSKVSHSSNGLFLCRNGNTNYSYIVCNLTTQKFIPLPKPSFTSSGYLSCMEEPYLIFDPTKSPHYKVVLVNSSHLLNASQLAIYTSEFASWKNVSLEPRIDNFRRGVIWNGGIIWRSCSRCEHIYYQLDVDTEKLTVTRVPPDPNLSTCVIYFGECGGRLLLIQLPINDAMEFKVFEMDRDDFRWIVRYRVDLTSLILPNRSRCVISVISVVRGANENDLEVVFYNRGKVYSCNLEYRTMKVLCELSPGEISNFGLAKELHERSYQFIKSLSPV
ncbi:F-box protein At5g07610-like [Rhododendron vialii]|uniref:F-box protein At5g07610-like n=1 Tax=Rhododendron vialii TaxID=182163 RepID=UPI00265F1333|nr:F-box protein At5g07610-like [Rhododendron vialii]